MCKEVFFYHDNFIALHIHRGSCLQLLFLKILYMGLFDFFSKEKKETLDKGLSKTKEGVFSKLARIVAGKSQVDENILDDLEEVLITSDVGVETTLRIIDRIEKRVARDKYINTNELNSILREEITALLTENDVEDAGEFSVPEGKKPYVIMVVGVNGVGKTTTTANIGTGLAKLGKKVVMIDTDTGLRNLDVVLGLENRIVYNLVDVVEGNCRLKQAMIADKRCPNLFLLPTAQTRDKSAVTPEQMIKVIDEIKNDPEGFDYIILDCPAGIEQGFQNAIAGADRALVVTTPEVSAIRDADRIVGLLDAHGLQNHEDLIVNRIRMDMVNRGEMMSIDDVNDILQLNVIGAVPDDENIVVATNKGQPLVGDDSLAGQAYMNICRRITGEEIPFLDLNGKGGFFKKLSSLFKSDKKN